MAFLDLEEAIALEFQSAGYVADAQWRGSRDDGRRYRALAAAKDRYKLETLKLRAQRAKRKQRRASGYIIACVACRLEFGSGHALTIHRGWCKGGKVR